MVITLASRHDSHVGRTNAITPGETLEMLETSPFSGISTAFFP